ncbi:MAG: hypothetical protein HYU66_00185 [Armatimonadetes bacterium]|nr:hypothetical protein [Armatimonadota bacterium]
MRNCGNQQPRVIYLDSVAAYEEGPQIPQFQPVPARLPFPTTPETILPPVRDSGVVAWVNGVAITRAELHAELERSQGRAVLETLILRRLSLERARAVGVLPTADEVPLEVLQQQVPPLYNVLLRLKENQLCQQPVVVKDFFVIVKLLKRFPAERSDYRNERTRKEVRARYLQSNAIPEEQVLKELHVGAEVMVLDDRYRAAIESEFPASAAHRPVPVAAAHTAVEPDSPVNEVALAQIGNRWHWTCRAGGETIEYDYVPRTGTLSDLTVRQGEVSFKPADGAGLTWETGGESYGPADPRVTRRLLSARFDRDAVRTCWRLSVGGASVEYFLTLRAKGKSLIHEWRCTAPQMTGLSLGRAAGLTDGRLFMVPYYTVAGQGGAGILYDRGVYASHLLDWYVTDASHFYGGAARVSEHEVSYNGGCGYARLTDGTRNPLHERGFLTVSRRFEDVLPTIPNPPSPLTSVLRDYMYTHLGGTAPNRFDVWLEQFKRYRRYGIDKLIVTQHEDSWTQGADVGQGPEEYTMTVDGPPDAGGDSTLLRYYAGLRELGYYVGPYNNYTDYSPLGKSWAEENVTRLPDGEWQRVWPPCFNIRPLKAAEMQAHYAPAQHAKFGVNAQYCDVHTCIPPWADVDYQAGTPGAGKLRTTFESYGRLLMNNRPAYGGPSFSEGTHHVFYAGLVDGSYAQMGLPDPPSQPLLVDFDLRRLHPQGADLSMLPGAYWNDDEYDCMSATIAYGHAGFFPASGIPQACRYYYLVGALQREYVQVPVRDIGYWDGAQFVGISDALPRDVNRRGQLRVVYQSGLTVWVNRNAAPWDLAAEVPGLQLTQHGWLATHGDGFLTWSTRLGGRRLNYARCAAYTFAEAGGEWHDFGDLATDGEVCLRRDAEGGPRLIAIAGMTRAAVPAGAGVTRVLASDESGKPLGEVKYARDGGRIVFEAVAGAVNYDLR